MSTRLARFKFSRGQTIVEAIVVIMVVVLLATGLIAGTTSSLKSSQTSRTRSEATKFAEEGLEFARSQRDAGWTQFSTYAGNTYCLDSDNVMTAESGECPINVTTADNKFARSVTFSWDGTKMTVVSKVEYLNGTAKTNVSLTTYLTNWR